MTPKEITNRKKVCIVGAGPAGLMAGSVLLNRGFEVHFFDHKKAAGRKFLVAGHGGFNLSHNETTTDFVQKYDRQEIKNAVLQFDNQALVSWLNELGIETFVGSSGKIFPKKGIKPIEVLEAWLAAIRQKGGVFHFSKTLVDFSDFEVSLQDENSIEKHNFDFLILAMGGASWSKTGSSGSWTSILEAKGIELNKFEASNSGFEFTNWKNMEILAGESLKNIAVYCGENSRKGDVTISEYGLEGPPIYAANRPFRENKLPIRIDFKPTKGEEEVRQVLSRAKSITEGLKKLKLSKTAIAFIKLQTTKDEFMDVYRMTQVVKSFEMNPKALRPIDEVISTVGGVPFSELDATFQFKKLPRIYACGEMIDWDAPTGGYLLQACFATGNLVGRKIGK